MAKFLKNTKTGVIFNYTDTLAARNDMAPCDVKGRRVYDGDAEEREVVVPAVPDKKPKAPKAPKVSIQQSVDALDGFDAKGE